MSSYTLQLADMSYIHNSIGGAGSGVTAVGGDLTLNFVSLPLNSIYEVTANLPGLASNLSYGSCLFYRSIIGNIRSIISIVESSDIGFASPSFNELRITTTHTSTIMSISVIRKI